MTDVPPGNGEPAAPVDDEADAARRSSFTPPGDASDLFDDDSLADAMAAEVRAYTTPITLPGAVPMPAPVPPVAETAAASAVPSVEPSVEPIVEPDTDPGVAPVAAAVVVPPAFQPPSATPAAEPVEQFGSTESTLEAIERLESELRRRAGESQPVPVIGDPSPDRIFPSPYRPFGSAAEHPPTADVPVKAYVIDVPEGTDGPDAPETEAPDADLAPPASDVSAFDAPESATPESTTPESTTPESTTPTYDLGASESSRFAPPPLLVEPPALTPPPGLPPELVSAPPPTAAAVDFSLLPPPVGLQPAALPPYEPEVAPATFDFPPPVGVPVIAEPPPTSGSLAPVVSTDFEALLGSPPHGLPSVEIDPDSDDDVVDEIDRAFPGMSDHVDLAGPSVSAAPSQPIATVRLAEDEPGLVDERPEVHPVFEVESAGPEPTALDLRAGRAARLFWLWFAANSSVVSLAVGATLFQFGMSLRQAIVATLAGVAISFLPLGLGTLAGKWSGQPTMIVSRATFGLVGNVVPAILAILSRVFWGGALLWLLAASVGRVLVDSGLDAGLGETTWTLIGLVAGFVIATVVAVFGYGFVARLQLVLSIATGVLILGAAALTYEHLDFEAALTVPDGPWVLVAGGAVLVFSFLGLAWVHSSSDVARYQRTGSSGGSSMLWATFGATLPAFLLIGWGAMLAASDPALADGLATAPLRTIATLLPAWYPAPLLGAAALGLLSGAVLTMYSGGFAIQALGVRARRSVTTLIAALLVAAAAAALIFVVPDAREVLRDVATTLAVPVAAWAGIFAAEMMVRNRAFSAAALLTRGGIYPNVRWVNLIGLILISAVGFGFTTAVLPGLDWQGFLFPLLGIPLTDPIATSDLGVFGALLLGILLPLVAGVPAIRRQERVGRSTGE